MNLTRGLRDRFGEAAVVDLPLRPLDLVDLDAARRRDAQVHITSTHVLVGPWSPGGIAPGACGNCLRLRWFRVRADSERAVLSGAQPRGAERSWPPDLAFVADAVALARHAAGSSSRPDPGEDRAYLTAVELTTLLTTTVLIEREPLCPSCGDEVDDVAQPWEIRRAPKVDGSLRRTSLAHYDLDETALVNPFCGVVGSRAHVDLGSTTTAPVAGKLAGRDGPNSGELTWSGQRTDYATSRTVGLLEGLERYAGSLRRAPVRPVVAAFGDLDHAVDPRSVGLYSAATYAGEPHLVPFDPSSRIPWVWGWSLRDSRPILVAERNAFYVGANAPDRFVDECSNGCASGSCLPEAILHGLLEVIERDAFLLGWYGNRSLPVIAVDGNLGERALSLVARAGLLGYDLTLLDNRALPAVPVVTAVATRRDGGLVLASGACLDPVDAALAALGEVLTYLPGRAAQVERRCPELEAMAQDYPLVRELRDHAELFGLPSMRVVGETLIDTGDTAPLPARFADVPPAADDLAADVRCLVGQIADLGHDVVVVDQTCPEQRRAGVVAVRVIVPGFLPIDFGWSRQRALHLPRLLATTSARRLVPHPFP